MPRGENAKNSRVALRKSARGNKIGQEDPHNSNKIGRDGPSNGKKWWDLCGGLNERDRKVIHLIKTLAEKNYNNRNSEMIDRVMIQNQHIPLLRKITTSAKEGRIQRKEE